MIKANRVGDKVFYLNPSVTEFVSGDTDLIAGTYSNLAASYMPYAYTSTVRSDYDSHRFVSTGAAPVQISDVERVSFGLFLTPQNEFGSFLFQLSGSIQVLHTGNPSMPNFFFGRQATNNTVVSSKVGSNNALAKVLVLPPTSVAYAPAGTDGQAMIQYGIQTELFALSETGLFNYCFGASFSNPASSYTSEQYFDISLAVRKHSTTLTVFPPAA